MTRMEKFLELFPNAELQDGVPMPFPCELDTTMFPIGQENCGRAANGSCVDCAERFWNEEDN